VHVVEERSTPNHFHSINRPAYQPKFGPIEYIFNEISGELSEGIGTDWDVHLLRANIERIAYSLGFNGKFNNTFAHAGM